MPEISLTIASRLDAVPLLGQLVGFICSSAGLTPVEENEVQVCVVEAVVVAEVKGALGGLPADELRLR